MNVHDEMSDSEVLRAASEVLSRISVAGPPDVEAITARGHALRNRRLASAAGLSVAAAATALALSLTGVLGASQAKAPRSMRTMSFTLVSHHNGTATLTINPAELLDTTALQNDLQQDGIPAHVTSGSFCSSNPAPAGFWHVVSGSTAPQNVHPGEGFGPAGTLVNVNGIPTRLVAPTITFNPAAIPAGAELSFGDLTAVMGTHRMHGVIMGLIDANSYTCTSTTMAEVSQLGAGAPFGFWWPAGQS
jgi:hypothetical protein